MFYQRISTTILLTLIVLNSSGQQLIQLPYSDDFENGNNGWTTLVTGDTSTKWELGTPNFGLTNSTHSGSNCWDINLDSAYHNDSNSYLYSLFFNCNGLSSIVISFWMNYNTEAIWDGVILFYK